MKKVLFLLALLTSLAICIQTQAICQNARPENVKECFSDPEGECCVLVYDKEGKKCAAAFCQDYNQCTWEVLIPEECVGRSR